MSPLKQQIKETINKHSERLIIESKNIFFHPELGGEEYQAKDILTATLLQFGFEEEVIANAPPTSFKMTKFSSAQNVINISFLAEYDALPEIGHGCGHHLISLASLAGAIGLADIIHKTNCNISVIGTPDEEGGGGKIELLKVGVFDNISAAIMAHPASNTVVFNNSLACHEIVIRFLGKAAHAITERDKGINALDSAVHFYGQLRKYADQKIKESIFMPAIISEGGKRPNTIADKAELRISVRAPEAILLDPILQRIEQIALESASIVGARVEISNIGNKYLEMKPNEKLTNIYISNLEMLGIKYERGPLGIFGSIDIGNLSHKIPCLHPTFAITPNWEHIPGHSREFAEVCNTDFAYKAALQVGECMAYTMLDFVIKHTGDDR